MCQWRIDQCEREEGVEKVEEEVEEEEEEGLFKADAVKWRRRKEEEAEEGEEEVVVKERVRGHIPLRK